MNSKDSLVIQTRLLNLLEILQLLFFVSEDGDRQVGVTCATTACGESGYEMESKSPANGTVRKPFLKSATVDYAPGSVSIPLSVVSETTRLNPKRTLHAENSNL